MGNTISSYIWPTPSDLSLDDAYAILNVTHEEIAQEEPQEVLQDYDSCLKTGVITGKDNNKYEIDERYSFASEENVFEIGAKVSYKFFLTKGDVKVVDIKLVENDWDIVNDRKTTWCLRTLMCKVVERQGRKLILNPDYITIDLNQVFTEFIPIVGDWIELEVKCEINEEVTDLSGDILEVNKISPVRPNVVNGAITAYNLETHTGVINKTIFFNKSSLPMGYIPSENDKIVAEVIESEQGRYTWRAIKLLPNDFVKKVLTKSSSVNSEVKEHTFIKITSEVITLDKLQEKTQFFILINNTGEETCTLQSAKFSDTNGQCTIISNIDNVTIEGNNVFKVLCECIGKSMGESQELIIFNFQNFQLQHYVNIVVKINNIETNNYATNQYSKLRSENRDKNLIKGQALNERVRFVQFKIPDYPLPKKIFNVYMKFAVNALVDIRRELQVIKPCLFSDLTIMNYEDKFHTLLHLEEISELLAIQRYDQDLACFIRNGEYLMLEIPNLQERRPSLLVGDKILATDPSDTKTVYEGIIHETRKNHVCLKFSSLFHNSYDGRDYSIKAVCGRGMYRRLHHAVHLAVRHLGKEILFPTQLIEKNPQVLVSLYEKWTSSKKLTPQQVMKRMLEYRSMSPGKENQENGNSTTLKSIEWYNKNLNKYQKDAVKNILLGVARPLPYIIFGPPGTGKTVTLIETILQIIRLMPHSRLLVAAPSNSAADLIALRLIGTGILRPGDLVRIVSQTYLVAQMIPLKLVPYSATVSTAKDGTGEPETLTDQGMKIGCSSATIGRHRITVTTCGNAGRLFGLNFKRDHFTHIIVDEAGQASEPEVLIPLTFMDKFTGQIILAGDPIQLGPVILNNVAGDCGLGESFLERLLGRFPYLKDIDGFSESAGYDPRLVTKLRYNYRSLEPLLKLTSSLFYNDDLIPTITSQDSEEFITLQSLKDILPQKLGSDEIPSLIFHGVKGENCKTPDSPSFYNPHEISQVFYYVNELCRMGMKSKDIGIITPYIKQVREIRKILNEAEFDLPKIGTVEEFQGQELNVIIFSAVRSSLNNYSNGIGNDLQFISNPRRLNVAISRAKVLLIIIGNPELLCQNVTWQSIIRYCMQRGVYKGCKFSL